MERTPRAQSVKAYIRLNLGDLLAALLGVAVLVLLLLPAYRAWMDGAQARGMSAQCKTVELALMTVNAEYRAQGGSAYDPGAENGLTEGAIEEIRALSDCAGELYLLRYDTAMRRPLRMVYVEGEYVALYEREGDSAAWSVYKTQALIPTR